MAIVEVVPGGPGAEAGLAAGDRILSWDGEHLRTEVDLGSFLAGKNPGDQVALEIERDSRTLPLAMTLGDRGGNPSLGLSLGVVASASEVPATQEKVSSNECRSWLRATYKVSALSAEFGLDFDERLVEMNACVDRDLGLMPPSIPRGWCDNVFKVHCAGVDLLAEIGDVVIERCEAALEEALGIDVTRDRTWALCGEQKVFDAYSLEGIVSDPTACQRIFLDECGAELEGSAQDIESSVSR